jgi:ABC-type lipoprotein release transport system permease subunit
VRSGDTATLATAGATLLLAGLAASWWPARRAARTDPAVVLREE